EPHRYDGQGRERSAARAARRSAIHRSLARGRGARHDIRSRSGRGGGDSGFASARSGFGAQHFGRGVPGWGLVRNGGRDENDKKEPRFESGANPSLREETRSGNRPARGERPRGVTSRPEASTRISVPRLSLGNRLRSIAL